MIFIDPFNKAGRWLCLFFGRVGGEKKFFNAKFREKNVPGIPKGRDPAIAGAGSL